MLKSIAMGILLTVAVRGSGRGVRRQAAAGQIDVTAVVPLD